MVARRVVVERRIVAAGGTPRSQGEQWPAPGTLAFPGKARAWAGRADDANCGCAVRCRHPAC